MRRPWSLDRCSGIVVSSPRWIFTTLGAPSCRRADAGRAEAAVIHDEGGAGLAAQQFHLVVDAEAAARLAGAARPLAQGEAAEQHRIILLHHLHWRGLGNADGRAAVGQPVVAGIAAIAAAGDLVHDVAGLLRRVEAAEREVAGRAGGRGGDLVRDRLHQRQEHRFRDALGDFRCAAGDRAGVLRVEEGALGLQDGQRLEGAGVDRHIREDVLDAEIDRRAGGGEDRVHRPLAGRR